LVRSPACRRARVRVLGPHVGKVINLFGLAIRQGLTAKDLKITMFAYPTGASDIGYMLKARAMLMRTYLT
jgi:hypothetical protein